MRSLFVISGIVANTLASRPVDESALDEELLAGFIHVVCAISPESVPTTIPPAVGRSVGKYLCQWARLSEDRFIALATETVNEVHDFAKNFHDTREWFQENVASTGFDDEDSAYLALTKRYYKMLRSFDECKALL